MPQISKIRIVNFNYNDGKRFIPDELYDLSASSGEALNSLFNLNNGGGKTVLVQLMMQPIHPKAMAGGRRIEDYFTRQGDHSYVLIEWNTDGSKEKLLTGIAMAASISNSTDEQRGNSIRYYTFKTVYENYSPYSIAALDLSQNENGRYVPAAFDYVRERAKTSRGELQYFSSDDSVKWAEELSNYGILRSEWENVMEVLNKDEGGLNQYFDEAKTSDKLIEKFFLPAIEQKMKSAANSGADGSLETMLISYAKKITEKEAVIQECETNKRLLSELRELNEASDRLYTANDEYIAGIGKLRGFKSALSGRITALQEEITIFEAKIEEQKEILSHIEQERRSKFYHEASDRYENAKAALDEAEGKLNACKNTIEQLKYQEDLLQCVKLYRQIVEKEGEISELRKLIDEKENHSEDAERIACLKYSVRVKATERISVLEARCQEEEARLDKENQLLVQAEQKKKEAEELLSAAKDNYNKCESELKAAKKASDRRIQKLEIGVIRHFDGFYSEEELEEYRTAKTQEQKKLRDIIAQLQEILDGAEKRKEQIPEERSVIDIKLKDLSREKQDLQSELEKYDTLYGRLAELCRKYSLTEEAVSSGLLSQKVQEEYESAGANKEKYTRDRENCLEKLKASKGGYLHILPRIMEYVRSTGIACQTGEEYLCRLYEDGDLNPESLSAILDRYPFAAYCLLFDSDSERTRFTTAGNIEWLPASVPLLTMEQMLSILKGEMTQAHYLAVCDRNYFADREEYCGKVEKQIEEYQNQIKRYEEHIHECDEETGLINQFTYPTGWRSETSTRIDKLTGKIMEYEEKKTSLEKEYEQVKAQIQTVKQQLDNSKEQLQQIGKWLEDFAELQFDLSAEAEENERLQALYADKKRLETEQKKAAEELETVKTSVEKLQAEIKEKKIELEKVREMLTKVRDARETAVADGELDSVYAQYITLYRNISESLDKLNENLQDAVSKKSELQKELAAYRKISEKEYVTGTFSPERLEEIKESLQRENLSGEILQKDYDGCNAAFASRCSERDNAKKALEELGVEVLPREKIGDNFKEREASAKADIKANEDKKKTCGNAEYSLRKISDKADAVLDEISYVKSIHPVELADNVENQWQNLRKQYQESRDVYRSQQEKMKSMLWRVINDFKGITLAEVVGKLKDIAQLLEDSGIKGDRLFTVSESIGTMIDSIEKINRQIETDLSEIENDFEDIVNQCVNQGRRMYEDLRAIAASSKAHIFPGKPQTQMVKMSLPEENEISQEASRIAIKTELESGAKEIRQLLWQEAEEKEITKRARKIVSSKKLLLRYIKQDSIQVRVYKIDMNYENSGYKRWEDTLTQSSGAEKFVVFFAVVLTLMNYTRSSAGLVNKNSKSVLILDNPFGKITSAHLLRPMFDIAKHFNVQLICLSDINKSDVINCFDCIIKLVIKAQTLSNWEIMTHEGNEKIEHGYYKVMNGQMSLF